jgi:hypothetical protein
MKQKIKYTKYILMTWFLLIYFIFILFNKDFYTEFITSLVKETNSILISFDGLKLPSFPKKEDHIFTMTLDWVFKNINSLFDDKETPPEIRNKVFPDILSYGITLMGHSSSGHPVASYLNDTCGLVTSTILLDPVDGFDPFGLIKLFITNPPAKLPVRLPTLIIATGLSSIPVLPVAPSCAPYNASNMRFYEALAGPTWYLNFTTYGHADILDDKVFIKKNLANLLSLLLKFKRNRFN